jgi:hypothetical protein
VDFLIGDSQPLSFPLVLPATVGEHHDRLNHHAVEHLIPKGEGLDIGILELIGRGLFRPLTDHRKL